jgi:hypothetical protein
MKTRRIKGFIGTMALAAAGCATYAGLISHTQHPYYAVAVLLLAMATSRMKVKLPGLEGNMSVNLPFLLAAAVNLSAEEAIAITIVSTVVQCWPKRGAQLKPEQMVFNVSMMTLATSLASLLFHSGLVQRGPENLAIALAAGALFLGQTVPVASIIALSSDEKVGSVWRNLAQTVDHHLGWGAALAVFPVMYGIHRSYVTYFARAVEAVEAVRSTPLSRAAAAGA